MRSRLNLILKASVPASGFQPHNRTLIVRTGYHVIATARRLSVIEPLRDLGMSILPVDVNSTESVNDLKKQVTELTGGKLDYLVNNAGRNYTVPALDVDIDEVQQTFETNVVGVIRMCQAFAPLLIEAKGCIVQIGSIAGLMCVACPSRVLDVPCLQSKLTSCA